MTDEKTISALVSGGTANAGPPLGPALAPLGVNTMAVVKEIHEKTKNKVNKGISKTRENWELLEEVSLRYKVQPRFCLLYTSPSPRD